jgi:hypothetical protein
MARPPAGPSVAATLAGRLIPRPLRGLVWQRLTEREERVAARARNTRWSCSSTVSSGPTRRVSLARLWQPDLLLFLSDTPQALEPLAALILQKTDGNPIFVIQFLRACTRRGCCRSTTRPGAGPTGLPPSRKRA